jgi:hypothetical protein
MANTAPSDTAAYKRLLSAARKIFARKGHSGTSVREIVAAAGVTAGIPNSRSVSHARKPLTMWMHTHRPTKHFSEWLSHR